MKISLPMFSEPIRPSKIICVGRNYAKHIAEMNSEIPDEPVLFLKPTSALIENHDAIVIPPQSADVHHEVELVIAIGKSGKNIPQAEALSYIAGIAVGLDMTARDIQSRAKASRSPWSVAKGFDTFAPLGNFTPYSSDIDLKQLSISLKVNGEIKQEGNTSHMLFPVDQIIAYCSTIFTLEAGDLIFTGTPEGVSQVNQGDVLEATLDFCEPLQVSVK